MSARISRCFACAPAIVLALGWIAFVASAQDAGKPYTHIDLLAGHPRIFMTKDDIPKLREKIKQEPVAALFRSLKDSMDKELATPHKPGDENFVYAADRRVHGMAFMYLMTGEKRYLDGAIARMDAASLVGQGNGMGRINNLPLAYDWLYNDLPPDVRQRIGKKIANYALAMKPSGWLSREAWNPSESSWNVPLAVCGDGFDDAKLNALYASVFWNLEQRFLPGMDAVMQDGAVDGYAMLRTSFIYAAAEGARVPTGKDLFQQSKFLRGTGDFWIHKLRGDLEHSRNLAKNNKADTYLGVMSAILASRYKDPYYQYMFNHCFVKDAADEVAELPITIIAYDPTIPERPLDDGYDKVRLFMKTGFVFMRDSWEFGKDSKAVHALFFNGPNMNGHGTQGHFGIARGADSLAIDSGRYFGDEDHAYENYYTRTVAHNSIIVYDPEEDFGKAASYAVDAGTPLINDGGQVPGTLWRKDDQHLHYPGVDRVGYRGDIERFVDKPDYTYTYANMGPAYRDAKVEFVTREFVYLKPNIFVVFDRVGATNAAFPKRFLLHMVDEPKVDGTEKVIEGVAGIGGVFESADSSLTTIERGQSRMYCRTLLPMNHILRRIGGPNKAGEYCKQTQVKDYFTYSENGQSYEFWVNGVNEVIRVKANRFNPKVAQQLNNAPGDEGGHWRIEVEAADKSKADYFLHVLTVGDKALQEPETKLLAGDEPGVEIKTRGRTYRLTFRKDGRTPGKIEVLEGEKPIVSELFPAKIVQTYVYPENRKAP